MCWRVTCCRNFCGCTADAQIGGGGAGIAATSHVGAVASAGHRAIDISGGNLSTINGESLAIGNILSTSNFINRNGWICLGL